MSNSTHYKSNPMYVLTLYVKFHTSYVKSYISNEPCQILYVKAFMSHVKSYT